MQLNELAKKCYDEAAANGWHQNEVSLGDCLMNIHSEISEAWEEHRNGRGITEIYYRCKKNANIAHTCHGICEPCEYGKPEGIPIELADVLIRVLDACAMYGIDIDAAVEQKLSYNQKRGYRHGGKII